MPTRPGGGGGRATRATARATDLKKLKAKPTYKAASLSAKRVMRTKVTRKHDKIEAAAKAETAAKRAATRAKNVRAAARNAKKAVKKGGKVAKKSAKVAKKSTKVAKRGGRIPKKNAGRKK